MSDSDKLNRRDFIVTTAGATGALAGATSMAAAQPADPLGPGFDQQDPLQRYWSKPLGELVHVDYGQDARELERPESQERHRIYSYLLMKLILRFWNGNKNGPIGSYPQRARQLDPAIPNRYRGDLNERTDRSHISWDRYLGHNIACVAVDGLGHIIDFDFNHNAFFRSTAEHAESRLVRRLFSLTDIFDSWKTGPHVDAKPHAALLSEVTLYTSLESCAQCSGVMSLAGVKQIVYMQNDFTAYKIGNIMYNLANRTPIKDKDGNVIGSVAGAPVPIPGSKVGLAEFDRLNQGNLAFIKKMNQGSEPFFSSAGITDRDPSITSFLCTDDAYDIFKAGAANLDGLQLQFESYRFPVQDPLPDDPAKRVLTNKECLIEAQKFFEYVDVEGYRGSPHKL
ncbi:twin-arginine translocation signal domain-containing protein [Bradyrhizobium erythrophlei]|uniref:twin-arginine translocation signal domain-containing protein n=1 Tax=Bradyrhizobium erythrophlei TaxID=1437360 RepID=UPI0035E5BF3B